MYFSIYGLQNYISFDIGENVRFRTVCFVMTDYVNYKIADMCILLWFAYYSLCFFTGKYNFCTNLIMNSFSLFFPCLYNSSCLSIFRFRNSLVFVIVTARHTSLSLMLYRDRVLQRDVDSANISDKRPVWHSKFSVDVLEMLQVPRNVMKLFNGW